MNRYAKALQNLGMTIAESPIEMLGTTYQVATIPAGTSSSLTIYFTENGTARLDKPNRTKKWLYSKSPAQLANIVKQTLSFYNFGR